MNEVFCVLGSGFCSHCDSLETARKEMNSILSRVRKLESLGQVCDVRVGDDCFSYRWITQEGAEDVSVEKMLVSDRMLAFMGSLLTSYDIVDDAGWEDAYNAVVCGY